MRSGAERGAEIRDGRRLSQSGDRKTKQRGQRGQRGQRRNRRKSSLVSFVLSVGFGAPLFDPEARSHPGVLPRTTDHEQRTTSNEQRATNYGCARWRRPNKRPIPDVARSSGGRRAPTPATAPRRRTANRTPAPPAASAAGTATGRRRPARRSSGSSPTPGPLEITSGSMPATSAMRRHQDRPQAVAVGLDDGVVARPSPGAQPVGVIDLQDRVLLDDAEQQQQAERRRRC